MPTADFNVIIHILDTVNEEGYSFAELADYLRWHHGLDIIKESLRFLCEKGLVDLFDDVNGKNPVPRDKLLKYVNDFYLIAQRDRESVASHFVELTDAGRLVLRLLGIGMPLSSDSSSPQ